MVSEVQSPAAGELTKVSEDGYVRMSLQRLCELPFVAQQVFVDEDMLKDLQHQDVPAVRAGFCEWADTTLGVNISIGWAWFSPTQVADLNVMLAPGGISTNVMLTAADGRDVGRTKTNELLVAWLTGRDWRPEVIFVTTQNDRQSVNLLPGKLVH